MLSYDDPAFAQLNDPRTQAVVDVFSRNVVGLELEVTLKAAGLSPGDYALTSAKLAWTQVVPEAARLSKLQALVVAASAHRPAFARTLEDRLTALLQPAAGSGAWYRHD